MANKLNDIVNKLKLNIIDNRFFFVILQADSVNSSLCCENKFPALIGNNLELHCLPSILKISRANVIYSDDNEYICRPSSLTTVREETEE